MKRTLLCSRLMVGLILVVGLTCSVPGAAQEKGLWRAASKTARSVTGDVAFSDTKFAINFSSFIVANIRSLTPAELAAAFDTDADAAPDGSGTLYRLDIPAAKKFLHGAHLCGDEDAQWIATYVTGRSMQLIFFSGSHMPVFTPDAISNATDLCGIYSYVR